MISKKIICLIELVVLFIGLPILFLYDFLPGFWKLVPLLIFVTYCLAILGKEKQLTLNDLRLWNVNNWDWIKLLVFPTITFFTLTVFFPSYVFADFDRPRTIMAIVVYPIFSSFPQEIIYRKFFYTRYSGFIKNKWLLIIANALLFSFAHIYFQNFLALVLTFIGGIAFSLTYLKSKSLLFVSIEHSIYGLVVLCSGMNQFFYKAF